MATKLEWEGEGLSGRVTKKKNFFAASLTSYYMMCTMMQAISEIKCAWEGVNLALTNRVKELNETMKKVQGHIDGTMQVSNILEVLWQYFFHTFFARQPQLYFRK